jgi:hypothetical protein
MTRWWTVVNLTSRPLYPQKVTTVFIEEQAGCAPEEFWTFRRRTNHLPSPPPAWIVHMFVEFYIFVIVKLCTPQTINRSVEILLHS